MANRGTAAFLHLIIMIKKELAEIIKKLIREIDSLQIYLFGSCEKGTRIGCNDYNIYLVVAENVGNSIDLCPKPTAL